MSEGKREEKDEGKVRKHQKMEGAFVIICLLASIFGLSFAAACLAAEVKYCEASNQYSVCLYNIWVQNYQIYCSAICQISLTTILILMYLIRCGGVFSQKDTKGCHFGTFVMCIFWLGLAIYITSMYTSSPYKG